MPSPTTDTIHYLFQDLVDVPAFARMMEHYFQATGVPNGVVAEDGELLAHSGWENACQRFHRVHEEAAARCRDSNLELMSVLQPGAVCGKRCSNGLMDYATPVVIEGRRMATLFLGQVLHEPPDMVFFRAQAQRFGFDEEEYLASIASIPVVDAQRMEALMACLVDMAKMLAMSGLARLRQTTMARDLSHHIQSKIQLEDLLDSSPVAVSWSNRSDQIEYINRQFGHLFGYTLEDIPDLETWYRLAYPDRDYRDTVVLPWFREAEALKKTGLPVPDLESTVTCKDGSIRRVLVHVSWVGERRLVNFSDITAHWRSEQRNMAHDAMLGLVASGSPLPEILNAIVRQVQSEDESSLCSVLLLDGEGVRLRTGAAPDLPHWYTEAIDGVEIGPGVGSCGTAAYLGERVIVEEIESHEFWRPYADLAARAGLRSCWSEPIRSSRGQVLGSFAIYHRERALPSQEDLERIGFAANLAAIAIENRRNYEELERHAYYDYLTGLANRRFFLKQAEAELSRGRRHGDACAILMLDLDHFKRINDSYGHKVGDLVLKKLAEVCLTTLRDFDMVGRLGGEEFAILLPKTDSEQAWEVAERLRRNIAETRMSVVKGAGLQFTASFGISVSRAQGRSVEQLLNEADQALYKAKRAGRNQVQCFDVE